MQHYPDDEDDNALAQIAAQGVDMSQPMLLEFAITVPDERSAHAVNAALSQQDYQARVVYDRGEPNEDGEIDPDDEAFGPSWTVYVAITMIPTYKEIVRIQAELDHVAAPLGGRSDGWGTLMESDGDSV